MSITFRFRPGWLQRQLTQAALSLHAYDRYGTILHMHEWFWAQVAVFIGCSMHDVFFRQVEQAITTVTPLPGQRVRKRRMVKKKPARRR